MSSPFQQPLPHIPTTPKTTALKNRVRRKIRQQTFPISSVRLFAYRASDMDGHSLKTKPSPPQLQRQCPYRADTLYANRPNTGYGNGCCLILRHPRPPPPQATPPKTATSPPSDSKASSPKTHTTTPSPVS